MGSLTAMTAQTDSADAPAEPVPEDRGSQFMDQLARETIRQYSRQLRASEPRARTGKDPEGVHDMRSATRALRAALEAFVDVNVMEPRRARAMDRRLRWLARALGQVRDLDVMTGSCVSYIAANAGTGGALAGWVAHLTCKRRTARRRLRRALDSRKYRRLLRDLRRLGRRRGAAAGDEQLVRASAAAAIWRRYDAMLSQAAHDPEEEVTPEALHALRIACKQLRYASDLFASVLGPEYDGVRETLVRCQRTLGAAHDAAAGLAALRTYRHNHPRELKLDGYIEAQTLQLQMLQAEALACRTELRGDAFRRALTAAIAAAERTRPEETGGADAAMVDRIS